MDKLNGLKSFDWGARLGSAPRVPPGRVATGWHGCLRDNHHGLGVRGTRSRRQPLVYVALNIVWYGMVWYGMVWYGMVWYGMIWYGMVWYGMTTYTVGTDALTDRFFWQICVRRHVRYQVHAKRHLRYK